ncbi:MAG: sugar dehydrogenase complex small subunit [Luteolibacter sp.]
MDSALERARIKANFSIEANASLELLRQIYFVLPPIKRLTIFQIMKTEFFDLSIALTGEDSLDERMAEELRLRIVNHYKTELADLLGAFGAIPTGSMSPDERATLSLGQVDSRHKVAREVIRVWYTGQFLTPANEADPPSHPDHYSKGVLWKVIKTHAPGYTNSGYGVWAHPPA